MELRRSQPIVTSAFCASRTQSEVGDRFVAADCGFDQRPSAVAGEGLPLHAAYSPNCLYMAVSFSEWLGVRLFLGAEARRNDDDRIDTVLGDGSIGRYRRQRHCRS